VSASTEAPKSGRNQPTTDICGSDLYNIYIRGRNLCTDLIGKVSFTQMLLFHLMGKEPDESQTAVVDAVLVTIMEHGMTPSIIAARQTYFGAPESLQGAVAAGILGVGSRFAGTSGDCATLLQRIIDTEPGKKRDTALAIAKDYRDAGSFVPGYGHPVHKAGDPRVTRLVEIARSVNVAGDHIDAMYLLQEAISELAGKQIVINASAAMGAVMAEVGIPSEIMRGITIVSRAAGVLGHLLEEMQSPASQHIWDMVEAGVPYSAGKG